jgi:hypothetical protein
MYLLDMRNVFREIGLIVLFKIVELYGDIIFKIGDLMLIMMFMLLCGCLVFGLIMMYFSL